ncbi:MAG: hypothetical protein KDA55_23055, partial [Planctomycetales bacterium]|nr:hypothetical protein [Planctomycetales bacterium]
MRHRNPSIGSCLRHGLHISGSESQRLESPLDCDRVAIIVVRMTALYTERLGAGIVAKPISAVGRSLTAAPLHWSCCDFRVS